LRYREGLTQVELAKQLNISQANLSAMEHGRRTMGKELAKRISDIFCLDYRLFL
jgi:transcriptional regulator with XRE-family HTH domain